jgi:hypothetical protein
MPESIQTVAVFNASEDTVEMLATILSHRGYRALAGHADQVKSGEIDFVAFLATNRLAGQETEALEIIGKPYDLEVIVNAVVEGLKRRDNAGPRQFGQRR